MWAAAAREACYSVVRALRVAYDGRRVYDAVQREESVAAAQVEEEHAEAEAAQQPRVARAPSPRTAGRALQAGGAGAVTETRERW